MEFVGEIQYQTAICVLAGITGTFYVKRLSGPERLVLFVVYLNVAADITAIAVSFYLKDNGVVYNILSPLEKIITLMVYYLNTPKKSVFRKGYIFGILLILVISFFGFYHDTFPGTVHIKSYIISGFIIPVMSYLHLRQIVEDQAGKSRPIFFFGIANLLYYTMMVSSLSALPVAVRISRDFALAILTGNAIAYSLWSIIITIGIVWKQKKN